MKIVTDYRGEVEYTEEDIIKLIQQDNSEQSVLSRVTK